jgi:hypothetical protein
LQAQFAGVLSNKALLLGPFVDVDPNPELGVIGPNIVFHGANIHIVSGSGRTDDGYSPTGLGNLIIGYDEIPDLNSGLPFNPGLDRAGSHNLVLGRYNKWGRTPYNGSFAFGGIVGGEVNSILGECTSVVGGYGNIAAARWTVVLGGHANIASADVSTISGGEQNSSRGVCSNILGGNNNIVAGNDAVVLGGQGNTATDNYSIVPQY